MIPEILASEVSALKAQGYELDVSEAEGFILVILHGYKLPPAYNKPATELLVKLPMSYPNGRPDMFWTDVDLGLTGRNLPAQANVFENVAGRQWRRFSWHPKNWNPGRDNLTTYLEFVDSGLGKAAKL